jgi:hypothetical protein
MILFAGHIPKMGFTLSDLLIIWPGRINSLLLKVSEEGALLPLRAAMRSTGS